MYCSNCGIELLVKSNFCSKCGNKVIDSNSLKKQEFDNSVNDEYIPEWWETSSLWIWLVLFFPMGLYGLFRRTPSNKKIWWLLVILGLCVFLALDRSVSNPSVSNRSDDIGRFNQGLICKAATNALFSTPLKIIKSSPSGSLSYISYFRPSDNSRWDLYCKIDNGLVIWKSGKVGSRWRNNYAGGDSKIKFFATNSTLIIKEFFSDGSANKKSYSYTELI